MIFILNLIFFKMKQCQGQTLEDVTVYLDAPIFLHGQLYVALSRTVDPSNLHVAVKPDGLVKIILDDTNRSDNRRLHLSYPFSALEC